VRAQTSAKTPQTLTWKTREDAERYQPEQYKNIRDSVRHLLQAEPNIRTFDDTPRLDRRSQLNELLSGLALAISPKTSHG
jgi:hypothetical protein